MEEVAESGVQQQEQEQHAWSKMAVRASEKRRLLLTSAEYSADWRPVVVATDHISTDSHKPRPPTQPQQQQHKLAPVCIYAVET